jgi:hypothetical protein
MVMFQASLGKKQDPIPEEIRVKKAGGMAQAVEHLPNKLVPTSITKKI